MDDRERAETRARCRRGLLSCRAATVRRWRCRYSRRQLAAWPGDVIAWEAKGFALGQLHLGKEGLEAFKTALSLEPNRESASTAQPTSPPRRDCLRRPSSTALRHRYLPLARTTAPNWRLFTSRFATGTPRPMLAGRPFVSIPRTFRSGSSLSAALSGWGTPKRARGPRYPARFRSP